MYAVQCMHTIRDESSQILTLSSDSFLSYRVSINVNVHYISCMHVQLTYTFVSIKSSLRIHSMYLCTSDMYVYIHNYHICMQCIRTIHEMKVLKFLPYHQSEIPSCPIVCPLM